MQKYISEQNLNTLLDTLIKQGTRVVAPRLNAGTPLYEPLTSSGEMVSDQLPRRSAKEAFFPVCEDIMSYEKEGQKVSLKDIDPARFPETVLVGVRPCDAAAIPVEVPGPAETDVVVQRARVVLGQDDDVVDQRVDAVREREVDDPVLAAERDRGLRADAREDREALAFAAGEDHGHRPLHGSMLTPCGGDPVIGR